MSDSHLNSPGADSASNEDGAPTRGSATSRAEDTPAPRIEGGCGSALDCWYLSGATATGKTDIGVMLAEKLGAEIISLDSMTLYRHLDIGTAKPSAQQRQQVRHHMIDVLNPDQPYSLSSYVDDVHQLIAEIRGRGREVLFVGGTPLYLKSLLRGIYHGPPADWDFRREVEAEVARVGTAALHARLMQVDPLSASKLHPNDQRRIIRALEVHRVTGEPLSHMQTSFADGRPAADCKVFVLGWERRQLHQRIETRVDQMFDQGLVDEVRVLQTNWPHWSHTAQQAVGYREVISLLAGETSVERTIEHVKTRTRRFAKRQETWFRSLSECRRIPRTNDDHPADIVEQILAAM